MKTLIAALLLLTTAAHADPQPQPAHCGAVEAVLANFKAKFGETVVIEGLADNGEKLLILTNPKTHTWTVLMVTGDRACMPAYGGNFAAVPQGDPV